MKIIYGRKTQKTKKKQRREQRSDASYSEKVRAKWFCCAFKVGFLQLTGKPSLIFKSSLELPLSIILKKEHYLNQSMLQWSVDV